MDILLINPKTGTEKYSTPQTPLNLLCLASVLEQEDISCKLIDMPVIKSDEETLIRSDIKNCIYVGISAMTGTQILNGIKISKIIREYEPDIPIIWGGVHPTLFPEQTIQNYYIDYVVRGEGEYTLAELIKTLDNSNELKEVKGITYMRDGNIISTPDRGFCNMEELHMPAWDMINVEDYAKPYNYLNAKRVLPIHASRGCPYSCGFCLPKGTLVLTSDLKWIFIEKIKLHDKIVGVTKGKHRLQLSESEVICVFDKRFDNVFKIETEDGVVYSTAEHPWLTTHNRWIKTRNLRVGQSLRKISVPIIYRIETNDYKLGYINGVMKGDGSRWENKVSHSYGDYSYKYTRLSAIDLEMVSKVKEYSKEFGVTFRDYNFKESFKNRNDNHNNMFSIQCSDKKNNKLLDEILILKDSDEFARGFLAGFYDAEGSNDGGIRIHNTNNLLLEYLEKLLIHFNFGFIRECYRNHCYSIRIIGGNSETIRFLSLTQPKIKRKIYKYLGTTLHNNTKIVDISIIGNKEVYNLETTTGNFIADGFVTHNCYNITVNKRKFRSKSAEKTFDEIKYLVDKYHLDGLVFREDNFCTDVKRVKKISELVQQEKMDLQIICSLRADRFKDEELLTSLSKMGVSTIGMGAESGSPRMLKLVDKNISPDDILLSAKQSKKFGFLTVYSFIIGLPTETKDDLNDTLNVIDSIKKINPKCDVTNINIYTPYPKNKLYDLSIANGFVPPQSLEEWGKFVWDNPNLPWSKNSEIVKTINQVSIFALNGQAMDKIRKRNVAFNLAGYLLHMIEKFRWNNRLWSLPYELRLVRMIRKMDEIT